MAFDKFMYFLSKKYTDKVASLKVNKTDVIDTLVGGEDKVASAESTKELNQRLTEKTSYGVLSGLFVSAQTTPDMTIKMVSGSVYMVNGDKFSPTSVETLRLDDANASYPRYDIIYVNSSGVITYLAGTAQENPTVPSTPTGGQLLAEIFVPMGATTITNSEITDKRRMLSIIEDSSNATYNTWSADKIGTEFGKKVDKTSITNLSTATDGQILTSNGDGTSTFVESTSDMIAEGVNNLYHTNDRVNALIEAKIVNLDEATNGQILTSNGDGTSTFVESNSDLIAEGNINKYYTAEEKAAIINGTAIIDGAIDINKMAFITCGKNKFNPLQSTSGYYVDQNTGALATSSSYIVSEFIAIKPNTQYSVTTEANLRMCFYTNNKVFISGLLNPSNPITTPSNAYYVRYSFVVANLYSQQLEEAAAPTTYESYRYVLDGDLAVLNTINTVDVLLPPTIYAVVGCECNIYFSNIVDVRNMAEFDVDVVCTKGKQQNERWTYTPIADDVGSTTIVVNVYKNNHLVGTATANLITTAATAGSSATPKILVIGDSTSSNAHNVPTLQSLIATSGVTATFVGTKGSDPAKHEAISGASLITFLKAGSPFGYPMDFAQYLIANSLDTPDIVIINLGINDLFTKTTDVEVDTEIASMIARYNSLMAGIKAVNANVIFGIAVTIPSGNQDAFGSYGSGMTSWRYNRNNRRLVKKLISTFSGKEASDEIYLVPINTCLDTVNNAQLADAEPINSRNSTTIQRATNGVHPGTYGYYQIADAQYYWIKSIL